MSATNIGKQTHPATTTSDDLAPVELPALVKEPEEDLRRRIKLDGVPDAGQSPGIMVETQAEATADTDPQETISANSLAIRPTIYRDPADVLTIHRLAWTAMFMVLTVAFSIGLVIAMYVRRPDRIVVDRSSGRTLMINDREYGDTGAVQMGPERLTNKDKEYITREYVRALYQIDPATRSRDIERALRMMVPDSALKFARYLKQEGMLDQQLNESWQSVWTPQDISIDSRDPYTIRVLGRQDVTRIVGSTAVQDTRRLNLTLKLSADPQGRADRNLRSGFLIASIDYKELNEAPAPSSGGPATPSH
jgi:hypothetical protein